MTCFCSRSQTKPSGRCLLVLGPESKVLSNVVDRNFIPVAGRIYYAEQTNQGYSFQFLDAVTGQVHPFGSTRKEIDNVVTVIARRPVVRIYAAGSRRQRHHRRQQLQIAVLVDILFTRSRLHLSTDHRERPLPQSARHRSQDTPRPYRSERYALPIGEKVANCWDSSVVEPDVQGLPWTPMDNSGRMVEAAGVEWRTTK